MPLSDSDTQTIIQFLREHWPEPVAIYLFGSFADRTDNKESDIDLAVLGLPIKSQSVFLGVELGNLLRRDVDLIDLISANTILQHQIVDKGKPIWIGDNLKRLEYECFIYNSWQRLHVERAEIVKAGIERGKFYQP